jgi:uncharacterized protein YkwD
VAYCTQVATWDAAWVAFEDEVLALTNDERAKGADCGSEGAFAAAADLTADSRLRCAGRQHSRDMAVRDFFDHTNPDGLDPFDRVDRTGYNWQAAGENIAAGQSTPSDVVAGWMASDGHCANVMRPEFTHLGVGYFLQDGDTYRHYWTQVFAAPFP